MISALNIAVGMFELVLRLQSGHHEGIFSLLPGKVPQSELFQAAALPGIRSLQSAICRMASLPEIY